jgi:hypothetical protein
MLKSRMSVNSSMPPREKMHMSFSSALLGAPLVNNLLLYYTRSNRKARAHGQS